jgi:hypothetical protein
MYMLFFVQVLRREIVVSECQWWHTWGAYLHALCVVLAGLPAVFGASAS